MFHRRFLFNRGKRLFTGKTIISKAKNENETSLYMLIGNSDQRFEITQRWKTRKLSDITKIMYGYTAKAKSEPARVKYLRITDIQNNSVDWGTVPYCDLDNDEYSKYLLKCGDIVFARTGATTGKSFLIKNPPNAVFASYLIRVQTNIKQIVPEFLYQYFQTPFYWISIKKGISGSAQGGFNASKLGELRIPVPPLSEQKRIVAKLDQCFEALDKARANVEKNLNNAKELFQSKLNQIFSEKGEGWVEKKLGDCFRLKSGNGLTIKEMNPYGNYPVYGGNGITGCHDKFNLNGSQVIIGRVGALCGNARHINEKIWLTDNAFKVKEFYEEFDHSFLTYLLNVKNLRRYARQTAQPVISNSSTKNILLQFPTDTNMQKLIVKKLNSLKKQTKALESQYQQELNALDELKKSLLQKAFQGEL